MLGRHVYRVHPADGSWTITKEGENEARGAFVEQAAEHEFKLGTRGNAQEILRAAIVQIHDMGGQSRPVLEVPLRAAHETSSDDQPFGRNQAAPLTEIVQTLTSSGTTGRPLVYALTRDDVEVFTDAIAHTWFTAGVRPGDVVAHLVGLPMVAGGLSYADGFRRVGAALVWLGGFPTERILREMRRLRCGVLLATTSFGLHLAGQWSAVGEETGVPSRLAKVLCGGEPGFGQPEIRSRIAQALGAA